MAFLQGHGNRLIEVMAPRPGATATSAVVNAAPQLPQPLKRLLSSRRAILLSARAATVDAPPKSSPSSTAKESNLIAPEVAQDLYKDMKLGREFEEMCVLLLSTILSLKASNFEQPFHTFL